MLLDKLKMPTHSKAYWEGILLLGLPTNTPRFTYQYLGLLTNTPRFTFLHNPKNKYKGITRFNNLINK